MQDDGLAHAAGRVHELARSLVETAAAARLELAGLEQALAGPGRRNEGALAVDLDAARLVAIELADTGSGRDEVARHLRGTFHGLEAGSLDGVLQDVFG